MILIDYRQSEFMLKALEASGRAMGGKASGGGRFIFPLPEIEIILPPRIL